MACNTKTTVVAVYSCAVKNCVGSVAGSRTHPTRLKTYPRIQVQRNARETPLEDLFLKLVTI
nr:hypothetical protein Iba_chr14cCG13320 [Ipomoea batatas]